MKVSKGEVARDWSILNYSTTLFCIKNRLSIFIRNGFINRFLYYK